MAGLAPEPAWPVPGSRFRVIGVRGVKTGKIALNSRPNPAGDRGRLANRNVLTEIS